MRHINGQFLKNKQDFIILHIVQYFNTWKARSTCQCYSILTLLVQAMKVLPVSIHLMEEMKCSYKMTALIDIIELTYGILQRILCEILRYLS